jgi:hypothetical protein
LNGRRGTAVGRNHFIDCACLLSKSTSDGLIPKRRNKVIAPYTCTGSDHFRPAPSHQAAGFRAMIYAIIEAAPGDRRRFKQREQ